MSAIPAPPWRRVVDIKRSKLTGRVLNVLECGHSLWFDGTKAHDALYAKKRLCHDCHYEATTEERAA